MYVNIGPLTDMFEQIKALIRVSKAEKASEPETINQTYSTGTLELEREEGQLNEDVYSVREKVAEDLKKLAAMDTTKSKAEEFIELAAKGGWESAIDKFNELYGRQTTQNEGDPNALTTPNAEPFKLQSLTNLQRISRATLETLAVQSEGKPAAQFFLRDRKKQLRFIDQLYSLVPQDSNTVDTGPLIMEFKPDMSYYCVKDISVKRLGQEEYEGLKAMRLYREDHIQAQSLAAVHLNPENILKRMDFRVLTIEDVSLAEGNSGTTSFVFTVSLLQASRQTVTVDYATDDGTAEVGGDYQATSGTLIFNPGEVSKPVTVLVNGDTDVELHETFYVNLSNATNAGISDSQGLGTIQNDDDLAGPEEEPEDANAPTESEAAS
jgi:hypothetical protein